MNILIMIQDVVSNLKKSQVWTRSYLLILAVGVSLSLSGCGEKKDVTLEEYNRVAEGMSYAQVAEIIGKEGVQNGTSTPGPAATESERQFIMASTTYMWSNADNTNMVCNFTDDKLTFKTQVGLE
jgi:hypothetical protein